MNNGQVNIASILTTVPLAASETSSSAAVTADGMQQTGGNFAELLSGLQLLAETMTTTDVNLADQRQADNCKNQCLQDVTFEEPAFIDHHSQSHQITPRNTSDSQPARHTTLPEEVDESLYSELSDIASQMAVAAYTQLAGLPEVTRAAPLPVDRQQNAFLATEQPAVTTVAPVSPENAGQKVAELSQAATPKATVPVAERPVTEVVTGQQQRHPEVAQTAPVDVQPARMETERATPGAALPAQAAVQTAATEVTPGHATTAVKSVEVTRAAPLPVDRQQNAFLATEQPAVTTVAPVSPENAGQKVAELSQAATPKATVPVAERPVTEVVTGQQQRHPEVAQTAPVDVQPARMETERATPGAALPAQAAVQTAATEVTPEHATTAVKTVEVTRAAPLPVDRQQNAFLATEQPAVTMVAPVSPENAGQKVAELSQAATPKATVPVAERPVTEVVTGQQQRHPEVAQTAPVDVQPARMETERATPGAALPAQAAVQTAATEVTPEHATTAVKTVEVTRAAPLPVDRQQNAFLATEQPAVTMVAPVSPENAGQKVAELSQAATPKATVPVAERPVTEVVTGQQQRHPEVAQTAPVDVQPARMETERATPGAALPAQAAVQTAATEVTPGHATTAVKSVEVTRAAPLPVDRQQNAFLATEQPAVTTVAPVSPENAGQKVAELSQAATPKATVPVAERPVTEVVTGQQQRHPEVAQTAPVDVQPARMETERATPGAALPAQAAVQTAATEVTPGHATTAVKSVEVTRAAPLPVDRQQNAFLATEQPAVTTVAPVSPENAGQKVAELSQAATPKATVPVAERPVTEVVTGQQQRHPEVAQTAPVDVQPARMETERATPGAALPAQAAVQTAATEVTPEHATTAVKTVEVTRAAPLPVDRQQNAFLATEQPAVTMVAPVSPENAGQKVAELSQAATPKATVPVAERPVTEVVTGQQQRHPEVAQTAPVDVQPARMETERATSQISATMSQNSTTPPVPTADLELEIQLSQPRPITARAAAVSVSNTAAFLESHNTHHRLNSDLQIESARGKNEASAVKEVTSPLPLTGSDNDSMTGSDFSHSSGNNPEQYDDVSAKQVRMQDMTGQLVEGHQKTSKTVPQSAQPEQSRQVFPEQIVQQLKDRLVQYDVKQGNQQMTLTLSPDNIGELKVNLNLKGQNLSVEIITETRMVRDAIVQHTDALKESLARQNITMESFDVTTGGKGSGNQAQNQNAWRELTKQQQQQQFLASPRGYNTARADLPLEQTLQLKQQGHSMLDIHY